MEGNREAIYSLLRTALSDDSNVSMPAKVDWPRLVRIVQEQGVAAIVLDGLSAQVSRGGYPVELDMKTKLQWIAASENVARRYALQLASAKKLSMVWHKKGIRTLVLKGFAFAGYYPSPNQRPASDLDCYLCGRYKGGNGEMEYLGIKVSKEDYRHSTFTFENIFVENHKICTTVRGSRQCKIFEAYLRSLLDAERTEAIDGSWLEKPCDRFNALYFLQHCHRHFLREGITLRYICDWAMIIKIVIRNERNMGLNYTLNHCLEYADTEYCARMDGDDISLPTRFEKEINFLDGHKEYAIVSCGMEHFDEEGVFGRSSFGNEIPTKETFAYATPHCHAPCMVRTEAYKAVGGYTVDKRLLRNEDYNLWVKMYAIGLRGYNIPEHLYAMRDDRKAVGRRNVRCRLNSIYSVTLAYRTLHFSFFGYVRNVMEQLLKIIAPTFIYNYFHRKRLNPSVNK